MADADPQRVMLITGTRKGLGRFLAEAYLAEGWWVVGCSRGPSSLAHMHYTHHELDVGDEAAVVEMFRAMARERRRLDALINNAGIASMNAALLTPGSTVTSVFRTNVHGTFVCAREAAKLMLRQPEGRIVNFTTVAVPLDLEGEAVYSASKAAVEQLTRVLARELGRGGVTVNAVGPSPVETDLVRVVPKDKIQALLARQAQPRLGTPAEVKHVVDFFLRPESRSITGQILYLGGVQR